jgi:hypothetical protein
MVVLRAAVRLVGCAAIVLPVFEAIARQLTRTRPMAFLPESPMLLAAFPLAGVAVLLLLRRPLRAHVVLAALFASGLAMQLQLGARLQSDGFYYFAYLRSLAFDRDVNFLNDYRMLGLTDKPYLFEPTNTGHAPSAWTIGPAIAWAPFFAAGHAAASALHARGLPVSTDGTSYPYRQAVAIAGLFYALLGGWLAYRFTRQYLTARTAAAATVLTIAGSFMLWYALAEPTMTHAPSMAVIAGFAWAWSATRGRRTLVQWVALGALAGLAGLIRWQNVLFALLPAAEALALLWQAHQHRDRAQLQRTLAGGAAFAAAATIVFVPQMLAWKAIYGSYLAVSPLGPQIHWFQPQLADILFSSRNGLLAMSPILYVALIGLIVFARRQPAVGVPMLIGIAAMTYFNACIHDWWGSASYGGRRFDGAVPLLVPGAAVALDGLRAWIGRRPQLVAAAAAAVVIVWHVTFMRLVDTEQVRSGDAVAFRDASAGQARTLHGWIGHPFTYPASLWFAARNGLPPASYDVLHAARYLTDPARPYGRVDIGVSDDVFLDGGWRAPERDGDVTYRAIDGDATLLVPLDRAAPLNVQVRARALDARDGRPRPLTIVLAGRRYGPVDVPADWTVLTVPTPPEAWRGGVNRMTLTATRAAIDYVRVQVRPD